MVELPIWNESSFTELRKQYQGNRLPHGMLIVGHKGNGSGLFLKQLFNYLLCLSPGESACGTCKACHLASSGHHPDFVHIEPEGKSMTIKVDAIRSMTQKISETAQQSGNKVVYIESAQKMNANAANALLKVLEEPTSNTFILLETDQLGQTLPTIRSRCRIVQLEKPSIEQAVRYIQQHDTSIDPQVSLGIALNRPLDALNIDSTEVERWFEAEKKFFGNQSFTELSLYVTNSNIEKLYEQILIWIDSALRDQQNAKIELAPVSEGLVQSLQHHNSVSLFQFRDYIVDKMAAMKRQSNLNAQLMAEELTSRWLELRGKQ